MDYYFTILKRFKTLVAFLKFSVAFRGFWHFQNGSNRSFFNFRNYNITIMFFFEECSKVIVNFYDISRLFAV